MKQRLFSQRFARASAAMIQASLPESQLAQVKKFEQYLAQSRWNLVLDSCPCGAREDVVVAEVDRYGLPLTTLICERCGALRINPHLDAASLDEFYRETYLAMYGWAPELPEYFARQASYGKRVRAMYEKELLPSADVLEVGCGAGGALTAFQEQGYCVAGCDLSQDLIEYGLRSGVHSLWHGTTDDVPDHLECRRFDLIFLNHVLEHMRSPFDALRSLAERLKPGGRILAIVPDITRVDQFPIPAGDILKFVHVAHKFNFTETCLSAVARQATLTAVLRKPPAHLTSPWSQMPELWMEFEEEASARRATVPRLRRGSRLRRKLQRIERRFRAGVYAKTLSPHHREPAAASAVSPPGGAFTRVWQSLRGNDSSHGAERGTRNRRPSPRSAQSRPTPITIYYVGKPEEMEHHARPLYRHFDVRIEETESVLRYARPGDVCLFYNEFFPQYRLVNHRLREQHCATLYAIDGILEWRSLWKFPAGLACLWSARPILSHKVACVGRSQARIMESWGHAGQCELVGVPRFDRMLHRTPRVRPDHEPFTILVLTAKAPGFDTEQLRRAAESLIDLKTWLGCHPQINGVPVRALWRITGSLENEVGVDNMLRDTTGEDLAQILTRVDAVITTPSTSMLEGMLQQIPVALLDYNNCPHYVPAAWRITASTHFDQVVPELVTPPLPKMLYQQHLLHDALECDGPALPRLCTLITRMHETARQCIAAGRPLEFPVHMLQRSTEEPPAYRPPMDFARLFPSNQAFDENALRRLQAEVGDLRDSLAATEAERARLDRELAKSVSYAQSLLAQVDYLWQQQQLAANSQEAPAQTQVPDEDSAAAAVPNPECAPIAERRLA